MSKTSNYREIGLKNALTITCGDRIRSYDFEPIPGRGRCYVEGTVVKITDAPGYNAFVIDVDCDVFDDNVILFEEGRVGMKIFAPIACSEWSEYEGRITKI